MTTKPNEIQESQISQKYGQQYDQEVTLDGYRNGHEFPHANRFLWNWYLTRTDPNDGNSPFRREALPEDCHFDDSHVLYGYLEPTRKKSDNGNHQQERVWVKLTKLSTWFIDRSPQSRGIWVESNGTAYYCLKEPCKEQVEVDVKLLRRANSSNSSFEEQLEASLPSQANVHFPLRAKFQLVSNLVDVFSEAYENESHTYAPIHARRTPSSIHALLTPTEEVITQYSSQQENEPRLNREPFDLKLMETCPAFVKQHMIHFHSLLDESSVFIQALEEMASKKLSAEQKDDTAFDHLKSALAAEERGCRTPWGELLDENARICPNLLISLEIKNEASAAANAVSTQPDVAESTTHRNDDAVYSAQNMTNALKRMGPLLDPAPLDTESGEWKDVEAKKFAVREACGGDLLSIIQSIETGERSMELMLLIASCLRESCARQHGKVLKKLFVKPKKEGDRKQHEIGAKIIGDTWRQMALVQLKARWEQRVKGEGAVCADELLLLNIIHFIPECYIIKEGKQLGVLKNARGLDWKHIVEDTLRQANSMRNRDLIKACIRARNHLTGLVGPDVDASAEQQSSGKNVSQTSSPAAAVAPADNVSRTPVDAQQQKEDNEETKKKEQEEAERKKKEEKDRQRRERMQKMMRTAQSRASTVANASKPPSGSTASTISESGVVPSAAIPAGDKQSTEGTHSLPDPASSAQRIEQHDDDSTGGWGASENEPTPTTSTSGWGSHVRKPTPTTSTSGWGSHVTQPPIFAGGWFSKPRSEWAHMLDRTSSVTTMDESNTGAASASSAPVPRCDNQMDVRSESPLQTSKMPSQPASSSEPTETPTEKNSSQNESGRNHSYPSSQMKAFSDEAANSSYGTTAERSGSNEIPVPSAVRNQVGGSVSTYREKPRVDRHQADFSQRRGYDNEAEPPYKRPRNETMGDERSFASSGSLAVGGGASTYGNMPGGGGNYRNRHRSSPQPEAGMASQNGMTRGAGSNNGVNASNARRSPPPPAGGNGSFGAMAEGRGRGRGRTLPSWMTKQEDLGSGGDTPAESTAPRRPIPQDRPPSQPPRSFDQHGRGKKRGYKSESGSSRGVVGDSHGSGGSGRGRGRGRGKDMNLPAWMTRGNDAP